MSKSKLFQQMRFGMIFAFILIVFGIHGTSASSSPAVRSADRGNSEEAAGDTGPFGAARYDEVRPGYSHTLFDVKFLDDSNIQASGDRVAGLSAADTAALDAVSRMFSVVAVTPVFTAPKPELDRTRERGELMSGEELPDLSTWMRYEIASGDDAEAFMKAMRSLDSVYSVEPAALPSPPPAVTPDFSGSQGYLLPSNVGIDAIFSWGIAGGDGTGITIFDVEYDWNQTHEDLSKINGLPLLVNPGDSNNSPFDNNHGTAVVGEVAGDDNGIGVTGISKGASVGLAPTFTTNLRFNPANAINLATAAAVPGDVILIEQQVDVCGLPSGRYGPQEWLGTVYAAIQTATANGIVVVEAAGNGNVNLDQAACGTTFDRNVRDSGAIIVGAGGTGGSNLQRLGFSSYGSRLDLQGWGENVMSTGYGSHYTNPDDPANPDYFYRSTFSGTSSASPIVTGAVANVQGIAKNQGGVLSPSSMRTLLVQTGTAQLPDETQKIGPRPDLAQAVAQILVPEIDVSPTSFTFAIPAGATDSDIMNIANLDRANLDWKVDVYTGDTNVLGDWTQYYDWYCDGSSTPLVLTVNGDSSFTTSEGESGTWTQSNNLFVQTYSNGTEYTGYIAGAHMAGTQTTTGGTLSGCWEADRIPPSPATVQVSERTGSGELVESPGATVTLPAAAAVERVDVTSLSSRSSEPRYAGTEIDLTTGSAAVFVPGRSSDREPAAVAGGSVLWDLTHGVYLAYEPAGNYSDLVTQLNGEGFSIDTTTAGVDNVVMMGDVNFWDNGNLASSDNALFASNVFNWLSSSWLSAAPLAGTTPGSTTDPVTVGVDTNKYTAGEYGLLVVHSNDGDEATIAVPVALAEEVIAAFSGTPTTGPAPLTVNFSNLSSGDYDTCSWKFGDSSGSSTCGNQSHIYTAPGTYTVELTVSGPGGSDSETKIDYIFVPYWLSLPIIMR